MTVGGSKGGIYASSQDLTGYEIPILRYWQAVGSKHVTGANLFEELRLTAHPKRVDIGIGNTCGLECEQCFLGYQAGVMESNLIPLARLCQVATEFVEQLGTRVFSVTDRDALTPNRSIPFFEHLQQLRHRYPEMKIGGITNGLAIQRFASDLSRVQLNYLDISVDGLRSEHDALRGKGTFDLTLTNVRLALKQQLAERIIITPTLTRFNADSIIQLICQFIVQEGIQWFNVGPLVAVKMQEHQLGERDAVKFLDSLFVALSSLQASQPVTVFFSLGAYSAAFLPGLIESGWLIPEQVRQDSYGSCYQDIPVNEMIKITLRPEFISEFWRHTLRITADGYVVGGCELLTQSDYYRYAVGNIQQESIQVLYNRALAPGSPFHQMMLAYDFSECRNKACFRHCLGGDSLLANAVYGNYNVKDPNCTWDEFPYTAIAPNPSPHPKEVTLAS